MQPLIKAPTLEEGYTEINPPELVTWKNQGQAVSGVLTSMEQILVKGKRVTQYTITNGSAKSKLLATYDLMQKLSREYVGCMVKITYLGEHPEITGGRDGTSMKIFSVQVRGTATQHGNSGPITDEDIPF